MNVLFEEVLNVLRDLRGVGRDERKEGVVVTLTNAHQTTIFHETSEFYIKERWAKGIRQFGTREKTSSYTGSSISNLK